MVTTWCGLSQGTASADAVITITTTPHGGNFAPKNVTATWIEDAAGNFVKTIDRQAGVRITHLVAWLAKAGNNDVDAVTGATRSDHAAPLAIAWNLTNKAGAEVPDGTYTLRVELADSNSSAAAQNDQGTYTFIKGPTPQTQNAVKSGGFTADISISPKVVNTSCNNGKIDPGETCDPSNSCPAACAASNDACMPNVLVGSAATCNSKCMVVAVTACTSGDGCCPDGCTAANDSDCGDGGGSAGGGGVQSGGCSTDAGPQLASVWALAGLALFARRRRRR